MQRSLTGKRKMREKQMRMEDMDTPLWARVGLVNRLLLAIVDAESTDRRGKEALRSLPCRFSDPDSDAESMGGSIVGECEDDQILVHAAALGSRVFVESAVEAGSGPAPWTRRGRSANSLLRYAPEGRSDS